MFKRHTLSKSIVSFGRKYMDLISQAGKKTSEKKIHNLRISTQRLDAVLVLASSLGEIPLGRQMSREMKKTRKELGLLRDLQVEVNATNKFRMKKKNGFSKYLKSKRQGAKKKVAIYLTQISLEKQKEQMYRVARQVRNLETGKNRESIRRHIDTAVKHSLAELVRANAKMAPNKIKEIHNFRTLAKRLRYQEEFANSKAGTLHLDLNKLKSFQSDAGAIQNHRVLLKSMDKYLQRPRGRKDISARYLRGQLQKNLKNDLKLNLPKLRASVWVD